MFFPRCVDGIILFRALVLSGALSALALSATPALAGCNSGNVANSDFLTSANCRASAPGFAATAVGNNAFARGILSTSIGEASGPTATIDGVTSIGGSANVSGAGIYSTAIGTSNRLNGAAHSLGAFSVAIGSSNDPSIMGPRANGLASIAMILGSRTQDFGISIGYKSITGYAATSVGTDSRATADSSVAFGRFANASGLYAAALTSYALANGARAVSAGFQSQASGAYSVALGTAARATQSNAVAIGRNSLADATNTVSVGNSTLHRRIVNVANGVAQNDAVTVAQLNAATRHQSAAAQRPLDELRREIAELRALAKEQQALLAQQQTRIAQLESRAVLAAVRD